ncbi:MAG: NfeD family protein [Cyanobacteria bacterium P01_F01_bin.33]
MPRTLCTVSYPGFEFSLSAIAIVDTPITHHGPGRVLYQASYWPARLILPDALAPDTIAPSIELSPGTTVSVVGRQGITLLVTLRLPQE